MIWLNGRHDDLQEEMKVLIERGGSNACAWKEETQEKATSALTLGMWLLDDLTPENSLTPWPLSPDLFDPIRLVLGYQASYGGLCEVKMAKEGEHFFFISTTRKIYKIIIKI